MNYHLDGYSQCSQSQSIFQTQPQIPEKCFMEHNLTEIPAMLVRPNDFHEKIAISCRKSRCTLEEEEANSIWPGTDLVGGH